MWCLTSPISTVTPNATRAHGYLVASGQVTRTAACKFVRPARAFDGESRFGADQLVVANDHEPAVRVVDHDEQLAAQDQ
jgi:hypothetical protein